MKRMFNKKKTTLSLVIATILLVFNTATCFAASSVSGSYNGASCYGSVGYGDTYAWGDTSCYGTHDYVYVSISVRYIYGDSVRRSGSSATDYYYVETEFGNPSYEILGLTGSHKVYFEYGGVWSGTTNAGSY